MGLAHDAVLAAEDLQLDVLGEQALLVAVEEKLLRVSAAKRSANVYRNRLGRDRCDPLLQNITDLQQRQNRILWAGREYSKIFLTCAAVERAA